MCTRNPLHCIIPPYVIDKFLEKVRDPDKRRNLLNTISLSGFIRGQRSVMGLLPVGAAVGTKRRAIYDARNGDDLPGIVARP
jgi:hypothetical protein